MFSIVNKYRIINCLHMLSGIVVMLLLGTTAAIATTVFIYHEKDGSVLITDHQVSKNGFRLVKRYHAGSTISAHNQASKSIHGHDRQTPKVSSYDSKINKYAALNQLDPALLKAVVQVESGFNPMATSKTGARGLMQLMPDTALRYGVTNSYDPDQNLAAGARHLRKLLDSFSENINLTLAAYNAGFENVRRFRGIPPFAETLRYIRKVTSLFSLYHQQS